jgi:hypothetical protein
MRLEAYYTRGRIQGCIQGFCTVISERVYEANLSSYICCLIIYNMFQLFTAPIGLLEGGIRDLILPGVVPPSPGGGVQNFDPLRIDPRQSERHICIICIVFTAPRPIRTPVCDAVII